MKRKSQFAILLLVAVAAAAALRLPQISIRPMHADEAVQAARFRDLWQQGRYVYDPNEFHGPTLSYATLPSAALSGAADFAHTTETTYRLVPVLFGMGVVVLLLCFADTLGGTAVLASVLLAAFSPAMVFYSRYYIHEMLLVFFTLAAIACAWQYVRRPSLFWSILTGVCIGLMQATKETAAISYLAAMLATLAVWLDMRRYNKQEHSEQEHSEQDCSSREAGEPSWSWRHIAAGGFAAVGVAVILLSSFFTNLRGPFDGVLTYLPWLSRAGGDSPHVYSSLFYLKRLTWWHVDQGPIWSEGVIVLLAVVGGVRAIFAKRGRDGSVEVSLLRWLACYTLAITIIYSVIPYKTPWCMLQFLIGMVLLAGVGVSWLLTSIRPLPMRAIIAALLVVGAGHLGWQAYRASYVFPADVGNPYVFAHTSPSFTRLVERLPKLAEASPQHWRTPIKVLWTDHYYWPLPWYLRRFEDVEYWAEMPDDPAAPIIISAPEYCADLEEATWQDHAMVMHELRPQVVLLLWVDYEIWIPYLERKDQSE